MAKSNENLKDKAFLGIAPCGCVVACVTADCEDAIMKRITRADLRDRYSIRIEYQRWGLHFADRYWVAIDTQTEDVIDYNSKATLIEMAKKEGKSYAVLRYHRDGTVSIVEKG